VGKHTAIPRTDDDTQDPNFLQDIANTAETLCIEEMEHQPLSKKIE
jgi:hypothetical protein